MLYVKIREVHGPVYFINVYCNEPNHGQNGASNKYTKKWDNIDREGFTISKINLESINQEIGCKDTMDYIEESEEKEISDDSDGEKNEESDYSLHFFFFAELYK